MKKVPNSQHSEHNEDQDDSVGAQRLQDACKQAVKKPGDLR